jgi:AcrR family transcriptional regulator
MNQESHSNRKSSDLRHQIISTATDILITFGYNGLTFLDIGRALNINHSLIHYHFGSKSELTETVLKTYAKDSIRANRSIWTDPNTSISDKFVKSRNRIYDRVCRYNRDGTIARPVGLISRFYVEMDSIPPRMQRIVLHSYRQFDTFLMTAIQIAIDRKELVAETPSHLIMHQIRNVLFLTPLASSAREFKKYDQCLYGVILTLTRAYGLPPNKTITWPSYVRADKRLQGGRPGLDVSS